MPSAHDCAQLLLETVPNLMRLLHGALRRRAGDDEAHTLGQIRMLSMLNARPWTQSELALRHHVTPSTMSRMVDLLVEKAWVERGSDPGDRRKVILSLTEAGRGAHRTMVQHTHDAAAELFSQLDEDERRKVYEGLDVLQRLIARTSPHDCSYNGGK